MVNPISTGRAAGGERCIGDCKGHPLHPHDCPCSQDDERLRLLRVVATARAYRAAETDGTPRLWRGKALQDLANDLDDALEKLSRAAESAGDG